MLDAHEQRLLRRKIVIVFCPPGRLVKSVNAHFAAAYDAHVCYLLFWGSPPAVISGELQNSEHKTRRFSVSLYHYTTVKIKGKEKA